MVRVRRGDKHLLLYVLRLSILSSAFFDDDASLVGTTVQGLRVHAGKDFARINQTLEVNEVLIALPSASRTRRREVIERLEPLKIRVRSLPGFTQLVNGQVSISDINEVDVADLLGRDAVPPSPELMAKDVTGKRVMVTGAGGSIGSEFCRQLIAAKPSLLILWELTEYALYHIEQELKGIADGVPDCANFRFGIASRAHDECFKTLSNRDGLSRSCL
jgi:FlaA1/EpsC-like NDP-sugar epimerase